MIVLYAKLEEEGLLERCSRLVARPVGVGADCGVRVWREEWCGMMNVRCAFGSSGSLQQAGGAAGGCGLQVIVYWF